MTEATKTNNSKSILILPCAGIEKLTGQMTQSVTLSILEKYSKEMIKITPSLPQIAAKLPKETENLNKSTIFVLNGCGSQCVTKILAELNVKCAKSFLITQFLKGKEYAPQLLDHLSEKELAIVPSIAEELKQEIDSILHSEEKTLSNRILKFEPEYNSWQEFTYSKFIFKLPFRKNDFFFNGNDVWAYIVGNIVFIGVTDYMQKQLSDILIVELPKIGQKIEQFDGIGSLESSKTVNEIISPVAGTIIGVNETLIESPELINNDPYTKGWIFAIEASNLQEDLQNLMKPAEYYKEMVEKIQNTSHK